MGEVPWCRLNQQQHHVQALQALQAHQALQALQALRFRRRRTHAPVAAPVLQLLPTTSWPISCPSSLDVLASRGCVFASAARVSAHRNPSRSFAFRISARKP